MPERLERGASYVLGHAWCRYVEPLKEHCDAALLVGAHAMAGTPDGVMCHTVSSEAWFNAWINETLVGESGIEAAICGVWGVPVVFVSGDEATCREVTELLGPKVVTAPVKVGLGRYSARSLGHADACDLIENRARQAVGASQPGHIHGRAGNAGSCHRFRGASRCRDRWSAQSHRARRDILGTLG
jgi:D-amino peptidase